MPQQPEFTEKIRIMGSVVKESGVGEDIKKKTILISQQHVPVWRSATGLDRTGTVHWIVDS